MKRPLLIFTIYLFVFMSVMAVTGPTEQELSTTVAQADIEK